MSDTSLDLRPSERVMLATAPELVDAQAARIAELERKLDDTKMACAIVGDQLRQARERIAQLETEKATLAAFQDCGKVVAECLSEAHGFGLCNRHATERIRQLQAAR